MLPSESRFLRCCSAANRYVLIALRVLIGTGCGVQCVVIAPGAGETEVSQSALQQLERPIFFLR